MRDLRIAARRLLAAPGFTIVAVLTLGLAIAATSAIFTIVEAVVLRPLPYPDGDRLVRVSSRLQRLGIEDAGLSPSELFDYRDRSGLFDDLVGIWAITANLTGTSRPERVETVLAGPSYFQMLGARAQLGRLFGPADYTPGISPVVVISDGLWRRGFGGDPGVIGRTLRIDDDPYVVIGVVERDFRHPSVTLETDVEVWAPTGWIAPPLPPPTHAARFLPTAIGRVKRGISLDTAARKLSAFGAGLRQSYPAEYPDRLGWVPTILPLKGDIIASARQSLVIVMAAVVLVLLIGCANIANLQLARAAARERDVAVRRAIGATSWRIVREQLAESGLVAIAGGALGLLLAFWVLEFVMRIAPAALPRRAEIGIDWTVACFTIGVSLVTGLLFGLAPALQAGRSAIHDVLKGGGRSSGSRERTRARRALIVGEFATAVVLLVGGALLVRSFWHLQQIDPGFDPRGVTVARVWLPQPNNPSEGRYFAQDVRARFFRDLLRRLEPLVDRVGLSTGLPLSSTAFATFTVEGWPSDTTEVGTARSWFVGGRYFETLGVPLIRGRFLDEHDDETHPRTIVINQTMARTYWPGQDPIGKRIKQTLRAFGPNNQPQAVFMTVVGMVGDMRTDGLDKPVPPQLYGSLWQVSSLSFAVSMKARPGVNAGELVRREVQAIDGELPVYGVRAFDELLAARNATRRFVMMLVGAFGVAALLLAALGIYGVIAYAVSQQRRELGIRMALGARPSTVVRDVLLDGLRLTLVGVVLGVAGAFATTRLLGGLLVGVAASDPVTFAAIVVVLAAVALAACWIPARRAAAVDPLAALRSE
jgi:putative ABC transport system permease protein